MFRSPMTLDRKNVALTVLVGGILVVLLAVVLAARARLGPGALAGLFVPGVAVALGWAMSPTALVIDGGELRVERRAWRPLRVSMASVASASPMPSLGRGTLRVFGVGGFFGSYGLFHNGSLGRFRLYATRTGQAVLVKRTGNELPLVLTPDDVAGAIGAMVRPPRLAR
jgi:hypothetical protein